MGSKVHTLDRPKRSDCRDNYHDDEAKGLWYCGACKKTIPQKQKDKHLKRHVKAKELSCRVCKHCLAGLEDRECRFGGG